MSFRVGNNMDSEPYPERPGEPDCAYYLRSGYCIFGMNCRFNHPPVRKSGTCKFHPPKDSAGITERVHFNVLGYPFRPNAKDCSYYLMTGQCKFRGSCRFNHPEPSNSLLSLTNPGQQSYPEGLTSFLASPNSSSYTQRLNPQGLVQVPSWNPFHEKLESASSSKSQQEKFWNHQFVETSHQCRGAMGSSASFSSSRFGSPKGKSSLQMGSILPVRPGQPKCPLYIQTGDCEFGANCRFDHLRENMIRTPDCLLNPMGYPLRLGEGKCIFYSRYGLCKFGSNCKFDHSVAAPKSIVMDSILTSASSGLPALTLPSKGSPVAGPSKSRHFPPSN